jgi:hypothetical protein
VKDERGVMKFIKKCITIEYAVTYLRWVPCHSGMARAQVAEEGDGLQLWRVAADILNIQSRADDKGWSCSFGAGSGLTTPHHKKISLL